MKSHHYVVILLYILSSIGTTVPVLGGTTRPVRKECSFHGLLSRNLNQAIVTRICSTGIACVLVTAMTCLNPQMLNWPWNISRILPEDTEQRPRCC